MNREVHVRFWESPEVKVLRATRHSRRFWHVRSMSGYGVISEAPVGQFCRLKVSVWLWFKRPNGGLESCGMNSRTLKLAANYLAFVKLASIRIWLRANESAPY